MSETLSESAHRDAVPICGKEQSSQLSLYEPGLHPVGPRAPCCTKAVGSLPPQGLTLPSSFITDIIFASACYSLF